MKNAEYRRTWETGRRFEKELPAFEKVEIGTPGRRVEENDTEIRVHNLRFFIIRNIWQEKEFEHQETAHESSEPFDYQKLDIGGIYHRQEPIGHTPYRISAFIRPSNSINLTRPGQIQSTEYYFSDDEKLMSTTETTSYDPKLKSTLELAHDHMQEHRLSDEPVSQVKVITPEGIFFVWMLNPELMQRAEMNIDSLTLVSKNSTEPIDVSMKTDDLAKTLFIFHAHENPTLGPEIHIRGKIGVAINRRLDIVLVQQPLPTTDPEQEFVIQKAPVIAEKPSTPSTLPTVSTITQMKKPEETTTAQLQRAKLSRKSTLWTDERRQERIRSIEHIPQKKSAISSVFEAVGKGIKAFGTKIAYHTTVRPDQAASWEKAAEAREEKKEDI